MKNKRLKARLIAFYLPQFHPISENDEWWGKGFTEWTNVAKAKPLFSGHYQPRIPADLGFYDLRVPETRIAQAEMAREYGIEGFCYWHYWFAGKRLLERPFNEVLKSGEPKFPFCLAWANQTWTGIWHGAPDRILIEQTYPGIKDYESHFYAVLESFNDERYIKIEGKPVFIVYNPHDLPESKVFTDCWREMAVKTGLKGLYFIGHSSSDSWVPNEHGFDAAVFDTLHLMRININRVYNGYKGYSKKILKKILNTTGLNQLLFKLFPKPTICSYEDVIKVAFPKRKPPFDRYLSVIPNWDNTPRSSNNGLVFHNSIPELFRIHLREAIEQVHHKTYERRLVFIKSWNEWAEGNYLEPDLRFGKDYLEVVKDEIFLDIDPI
jgi:lipopolysaccharide biosynthesis protein